MNKKRAVEIGFIVVLAIVAVVLIFLIEQKIVSYSEDRSTTTNPGTSASSSNGSTTPSAPSRCSLVQKNDTYAKPDFSRLETVMAEQNLVKDIPSKGKISLRFFHFTEKCRIWDKSYILSDGKITAGDSGADIYITLSSDYVDRITESNFCDIIKEARANDDLGQWVTEEVSEATLLWRYKGMLEYKECLGIEL